MTVPTPPTAGEPIAEAWGDVVHAAVVAQDIQTGQHSVPISAANQGTLVVTFARPFAAAPFVVLGQASNSGGFIAAQGGATTTQFTLIAAYRDTSQTGTVGIIVSWIAIGPRA